MRAWSGPTKSACAFPMVFYVSTLLLQDIRLFANDYVTPDMDVMKRVNERIQAGIGVILSVGLTRPFTPSPELAPQHWLQVNNIHLEDNPIWPLG